MDITTLVGLILLVGIFLLLALGVPIAVGVGIAAVVSAVVAIGFDNAMLTSAQQMFRGVDSFALLAIP